MLGKHGAGFLIVVGVVSMGEVASGSTSGSSFNSMAGDALTRRGKTHNFNGFLNNLIT